MSIIEHPSNKQVDWERTHKALNTTYSTLSQKRFGNTSRAIRYYESFWKKIESFKFDKAHFSVNWGTCTQTYINSSMKMQVIIAYESWAIVIADAKRSLVVRGNGDHSFILLCTRGIKINSVIFELGNELPNLCTIKRIVRDVKTYLHSKTKEEWKELDGED